MNGNSLKRITLYCMAGIALLLVVWAIFGSHGHGENLMAATAPEQPEDVQPEPRPEPEATLPEPEASQAASQPQARMSLQACWRFSTPPTPSGRATPTSSISTPCLPVA